MSKQQQQQQKQQQQAKPSDTSSSMVMMPNGGWKLTEERRAIRTRLRRRRMATVVGCVSLAGSTALVAAATTARAVDCHRPDTECSQQCGGRLRMYFGLMLAFSIMFIASLTGLLVARFILFPAPPAGGDSFEFDDDADDYNGQESYRKGLDYDV